MKRIKVILILCVLWIISIIAVGYAINKYIDNQKNNLRSDLRNKVKSLFEGQESGGAFVTNYDGFFDEVFSGYPVRHYKEVPIPSTISDSDILPGIDQEDKDHIKERWANEYGDLYSLYELNWEGKYPNGHDEGWMICRIHYTGIYPNIIETNLIFPYKVGLKETEWFYNPYSVEQAVNESYDFFTTNEKSGYSKRFKKGSNRELWSKIYECTNKYYSIVEREKPSAWAAGIPIKRPKGKSFEEIQRTMPYENGWFHNDYCRVFIAASQIREYYVKENEELIREDRNKLRMWWLCGISFLFLTPISLLLIKERKTESRISETLYQRLLRLCNPKMFMQDYNKEKIDKANSIYQELYSINPSNEDALNSLAQRAIEELGISIIDSEELKAMKEKANPANYMEPYDAQKVSLANEIYNILSKENISVEQYKKAKEMLKNL